MCVLLLPVACDGGSGLSAPVPKPRPTPPTKPKPPVTAPKPKPFVKRDSPPLDEDPNNGSSGEATTSAATTGEAKPAEGEIVYDSSTLRLSVKDKIKRLSQVKFQPPHSSSASGPKKASSLPRDAQLPSSVTEENEEEETKNGDDSSAQNVTEPENNGEEDSAPKTPAKDTHQGDEQHIPPPGPSGDDEIMV
ncbi:hypothetical protein ACOMHN_056270 [Nucella lapillus]